VDKHSTGGVADGVTLVFAPLGAALGLAVAKLSGAASATRAARSTSSSRSRACARTSSRRSSARRSSGVGLRRRGAVGEPRSGRRRAVRPARRDRDVASIPLIAASVMSKKLAVATDLIVLDVKAGSGAFMKTPEAPRSWPERASRCAARVGRACSAHVTDMSQPLGDAIGNALDVARRSTLLRGEVAGACATSRSGCAGDGLSPARGPRGRRRDERAERAIDDGTALERFRRMVEAQGGDPRVADDPEAVLPGRPCRADRVRPDRHARGRRRRGDRTGERRARRRPVRKGDPIDPAVGIVCTPKIGDRLEAGERIGAAHARTPEAAREAVAAVLAALTLVDGPVSPPPLVHADLG
jgi:pyrimidine-nucleoside phosphorylase